MFKYYSRLVDIESNCDSKFNLLRATFIEDKNLYNNKHPSWVQTVFQLEKMLNVKFTDTSYFEFKQLIETLYKNTLLCQLEHMKLNDTGKLRFYSKICTSFDLKQYLSFDLPKFNRSLITKIRISAHQLAIETGRYMKPPLPVPERFCKNCKNKVEDEKHFILYCPLYKNLRNKYIINEESQSDSDEIYLISRILNPVNVTDAKNLCIFLKESFDIRQKQFNVG